MTGETSYLSSALRSELWSALGDRLRSGAALCTNGDFLDSLCEIYEDITGEVAPDLVRDEIREMVVAVNEAHPETYLVNGVQNGIARAFEEWVRRLNWDVDKIQIAGAETMRRFKSGVQIGRVEMRVAGSSRRIPTKIMPDPEDPEKMCIPSRDPDSGEVVPAKRRGAIRYIEKSRDGSWREGR